MQRKTKKSAALIVAALALCIVVRGMITLQQHHKPDTTDGTKNITISVVHGDGECRNYSIQTESDYLGDALTELEDLHLKGEMGNYGLYIQEVDGEAASDADRTYWAISKDGTLLEVGADSQPITDGENYELTLTTW